MTPANPRLSLANYVTAMTAKIRTAALISGRGSNMLALAKAAAADHFPASIDLVISNVPRAAGLEKAQNLGIQALTIDHRQFGSRQKFEKAMDAVLSEAGIELICCAGFMRILSPWFVKRWPNKILNIHPSLLPKYKGLHTHQRALDADDQVHGCTVHWVNEELDGGDIVLQSEITIESGDTAETLAARLIPVEHQLYVKALEKAARELQQAETDTI